MFRLAWRNVIRRRGQSLVTLGITILTILSFVLALSVFSTLQTGLEMCSSRLGADIIVLPNETSANAFDTIFTAEPVNVYMSEDVLDQVAEVEGVETVTAQFFTQTLDASCCSIGGVSRLVGIDTETDFVIKPWLEGDGEFYLGDNDIIVGSEAPVFLGNQASILDEVFTVTGTLEAMGAGTDETIFMDLDSARRLAANSVYLQSLWVNVDPMTSISAVMVKVADGYDPSVVADSINAAGTGAVAVATSNVISEVRDQLSMFTTIVFGLWIALFVISSIALIGRFAGIARERKKEIGILRALGAQKEQIFTLILSEAWLIAGAGGIIGSFIGILGVSSVIDMIREAISLPGGQWDSEQKILFFVIGVLLALVMGFIAAVYPAIKSASLDPQEAMTKGELD